MTNDGKPVAHVIARLDRAIQSNLAAAAGRVRMAMMRTVLILILCAACVAQGMPIASKGPAGQRPAQSFAGGGLRAAVVTAGLATVIAGALIASRNDHSGDSLGAFYMIGGCAVMVTALFLPTPCMTGGDQPMAGGM